MTGWVENPPLAPDALPQGGQGGDIWILWDNTQGLGDWGLALGDVLTGQDLETACLTSLFSDALGTPDFVPTDGTTDRRGWWADTYLDIPLGSNLWQLDRSEDHARRARERPRLCAKRAQLAGARRRRRRDHGQRHLAQHDDDRAGGRDHQAERQRNPVHVRLGLGEPRARSPRRSISPIPSRNSRGPAAVPFARPTLTQLQQTAIQDITTSGVPGLTGLLRTAVLRVLSWCMAGLAYSVYGYADWIARMGVPFTAENEFLYAWAGLIGVYPKPAGAATGTANFTGNPGRLLPNQTPLTRQDGTPYQTTADGTVDGRNLLTVPIAATVQGAFTNDAGRGADRDRQPDRRDQFERHHRDLHRRRRRRDAKTRFEPGCSFNTGTRRRAATRMIMWAGRCRCRG